MEKKQYYELDILQLFKVFRYKLWAIILTGAILAGAGFFCGAYVITPRYEAEVLMYASNFSTSTQSSVPSVNSSDLTAAQNLVNTYIAILKSRTTLNGVIKSEGLDYTYEELQDMISAGAVNSTEVFTVKVTSNNPQEAQRIANSVAITLSNEVSNVVNGGSAKIIDHAIKPTEKVSPGMVKCTVIGFFLGVIIACIVIAVKTLVTMLTYDGKYLVKAYDLPVLAVVPEHYKNGKNPKYLIDHYSIGKAKETKKQC